MRGEDYIKKNVCIEQTDLFNIVHTILSKNFFLLQNKVLLTYNVSQKWKDPDPPSPLVSQNQKLASPLSYKIFKLANPFSRHGQKSCFVALKFIPKNTTFLNKFFLLKKLTHV